MRNFFQTSAIFTRIIRIPKKNVPMSQTHRYGVKDKLQKVEGWGEEHEVEGPEEVQVRC